MRVRDLLNVNVVFFLCNSISTANLIKLTDTENLASITLYIVYL